jgi:arginyl-tRNA synthetase
MNQWVYNGFKSTYKKIGVSFDYTYFESKIYLLGKTISKAALRKNIFIKKKDNSI